MFLFTLLVIIAFIFTIRKTPEKLLNRDQTEEWKGWMQVIAIVKVKLLSYASESVFLKTKKIPRIDPYRTRVAYRFYG